MHMQLTEQAMEFLAFSTVSHLENFTAQRMHGFMLGQLHVHSHLFQEGLGQAVKTMRESAAAKANRHPQEAPPNNN